MIDLSKYEWILFDWNGTLVDDLDLCLQIHREIRDQYSIYPISKEEYLSQFRFPLIDFYAAVGFDLVNPTFEQITQYFMTEYYARQEQIQLFQDVVPTLEFLKSQELKLGILSASQHNRLVGAVRSFGIESYFTAILGIQDDYAASKSQELKNLIQENQLSSDKILFVGDTHHDAEIAIENQMDYILIPRGHQSPAQFSHLPKLNIFQNLAQFRV